MQNQPLFDTQLKTALNRSKTKSKPKSDYFRHSIEMRSDAILYLLLDFVSDLRLFSPGMTSIRITTFVVVDGREELVISLRSYGKTVKS